MSDLVITLPIRLISEANSHQHWRLRQKRAKAQRSIVALRLREPLGSEFRNLRGPVVVTITRVAPRALDLDNAWSSAKHAIDGVADAFGIDDRDPRITWRVEQRRGAPKTYAVEIRIEATPPENTQIASGEPTYRQVSCASHGSTKRSRQCGGPNGRV
jgi:hypothetical protein